MAIFCAIFLDNSSSHIVFFKKSALFSLSLISPLVPLIELHSLGIKLSLGFLESNIRIPSFPIFSVYFSLEPQIIFSELHKLLEKLVQLSFQGIHEGLSVQTEFSFFSSWESRTLSKSRSHFSFDNDLSTLGNESKHLAQVSLCSLNPCFACVFPRLNVSENQKHRMAWHLLRAPE